jgi:hypothetical protein
VGARSGDSSRSLYQHSTLVVELLKNNVRKCGSMSIFRLVLVCMIGSFRYYLIPPAVIAEPAAAKLMKRGKKLHIFNEHTFVAVRIRGYFALILHARFAIVGMVFFQRYCVQCL